MKTALLVSHSEKKQFSRSVVVTIALVISMIMNLSKVQGQNCTVNAGVDQTICVNSQLVLYGQTSGLFQGTGNITWSQFSGPSVTITNPHSLTTTVTGYVANQVYRFILSAKCLDGSLVTDLVKYTVTPITTASAGPDQTLCPGTGTLAANTPGAGETGTWTVLTGTGVAVTSIHSPTSTITVSSTGSATVTLRWTIQGPVGPPQCESYDDVIISNQGGVSPVTAGTNQTLSNCYSSTTSTGLNASFGGNGINGQQGTWSVVSGPNIPSFANIHQNNTTVSNLIQGTYVLRWTVAGPCVSGTATMTIIVPAPTANVTGATVTSQSFCDGRTSFILSGNFPLYSGETVLWTQTSGPAATIASPNSPITSVTVPAGSGTYTFLYTISNPVTLCSSSATSTISFSTPPSLTLTAGSFLTLACGDSTATISYTQSGSGTVQWSIISGPATPFYPTYPTSYQNSAASPEVIPHLSKAGTYLIRFRKSPGVGSSCSTVFADINVIVSMPPTASNAGTAQLLACNIFSTSLAGNVPFVGTGHWTQVSGPNTAVITNIYFNTSPVSGLINGVYVFRWLISGGPMCPSSQSDTRVIVASINPTTANAGPDQTVCYATPLILQGNSTILNEVGTWTVTPTGPVFSDVHNPHAVVTGLLASTVYTFTWTIVNACSSSSDAAVITTSGTQGPIQSNAGPDQCLASGTTTMTMAGNNPSPGTGTWVRLTGPNNPTITNASLYNTTVTGLINGTYTFQWSISYNSCSVSRDTMKVTISAPATIANAGGDKTVCGTSVTLTANTPVVGTGMWTQQVGNAGAVIVSPTSPTTNITGLIDGVYVFRWTITNDACTSNYSDATVYVSTPPSAAVAGPDQTLCGPTSTTMAATTPLNGTGNWMLVSGPNSPVIGNFFSSTTTVSGMITGPYLFRWTVTGGPYCPPNTSTMSITVMENANAGSSQSYCSVTAVNLAGNTASTGTWTQVGTTPNVATITTTGSNTATASGLITGVYTFQYTISAGNGCPGSSSTTTVTISGQPAQADAGPEQVHCGATQFFLSATPNPVPGGQTGTWSQIYGPGGGSFSDVHSPTATFNGATAGLYVFVWTISEGSCSNGSQIRITNNAPPTTANAGPDQDVCGSIATMAANAPTNGTGNWSQISGPNSATFSSLILPNTTVTGLIEGTYVFAWTISNGTCPASTDNVTITVHNNPTVANAGPDQSLCSLTSVTLAGNIIASGNGLWTQAGGPAATINNPTQNNTTVTLPLPGVSPNVYTFVWTSTLAWTLPAVGSCSTSDTVVITNNPVPTVSNAGPNQSICLYSAVVMAANTPVVGTGTWTQTGGPTTVSFSNINSPTTSVNGVDVGTYTCRWTISNTICPDSYSDVQVTMNPQPTIAIAGPNQSLCNTTVATMAGNTPDPGHGTGTWSQISGPATVTFTNPNSPTTAVTGITSAGSYVFQWEIATSAACTSNDQMTVLKNADISIVGPSDATICNGGTAALSVTVSGGVSPYTYQWQQSNDGISGWISVTGGSGATSSSYTTAVLASDLYYRCQVTCSCGNMTSGVAHVTVVPDPSITVNPVGSTICSNTTWAMSVTASGGTPSLNYQWQRSTTGCGGSWTNIGANSPNYTTAALTQTTYYRVIVSATGNGCNNATSTCATVYVPRITTSPSSGTICTGGNFTMNVVVDGGSATLAYQWQSSPDNLTWGNVTGGTGANTATYTTDVLTSTTYYKCIVTVTSPNCADLVSSTATVTIVGDPNITLQPAGNTICNGGTSTLSVTATGGTPTLLYQWQYSLSNSPYSWSNVSGGSGGTTNTYTTPALAVTTYYRVLITAAGSGCDPTATTPATVTVVPDPTIDIQPTDATICSGTTTTITVSASGGTPSLNYQWQYSLSNSPYSWNNVSGGSGGTTNAYTTPSLASTTYYRVQISATGNGCDPINSNPVAVHIPHITTQPVNATVCDGGTQVLTVAAGSDGGTATFAYQWQVSAVDCSIGFFDIPLATTPSYTTPVLTGNRFYKCVITVSTPSCSNLISNCASVTVVPDPYITGQPSGGSICSGSTFNMTVTASGGTPSLTYQWQSSGALAGPYSNVVGGSGANTSSYTTPALAATTYYQVIVSAAGNGCGTATSVPVTVSVSQNATANAGGNSTICSTGTYTIAGSSATNFTSLLWTTSGTGTFNNPTALHPIYSPSAADITAGTVSLTLTAYATSPCSNASNSMTLTINIAPVSNAGPAQTFCSNITSATMAANNPAPGTGLWSKVSGPGSPTITTPASPTTTITGLGIGASVFRWTVSNGVCAPAVSDVTITRQVCVPVAVDDYATTPEDTPVSGNVLTNDSDPNGLTLSVTQFVVNGTTYAAGTTATIPGVGTLVINSNGTWTFTPALNYNGPVPAATYTITNGSNTASANLYITITPVNDPPVAVVDYFTTPEDTPVSGSVTGNDYDVDGNLNPNGYSLVTGPAHGTVSFNSNGSFTYTPSLNYNGQDSFIYSVCDLGTPVYCDTAIVHITIPAVNDPPVANNDYATTPEDTPVTISILSNDIDVDGSLNPATIDLDPSTPGVQTTYTVPGQGTFVVNPVTGIVTFTPVLNFNGTVTPIPYQVCDNGTPLPSQCAQALIHVTVTPVNDPPVANVDYYTTPEDTPVSGNVTGNDSDIDGNLSPNGFALYTPPTHGTITFSNNGSFTYTPAPNYNGPDSFIYSACDLGMPILCDTAIVYINITPVNDPPVANDDYATTPEDTPVTINILSNDIDVDGSLNPATIDLDPSTPGIQTTYTVPGQGTFVVNPVTGIVTFTPVLNFNGTVTPIPYQVCDNGTPLPSQCAQAVIHVTVTPVNDPPIVTGKTVTTPEDTPIIICSTISDVDPGSTFTAVMCGNPSSGTVSAPVVTGNQVCVTYTPNPNYNGTDNFCIQVCDNGSPVLCDTAQYTVNVTPVNDPPVANDDYKTTNEDTPVIILILSNDSDIDGPLDPSSIDLDPYSPGIQTSFTVPGQGTFQIAGTGVILFTPDMNFNGTVFPVTYQVCDNGIPLPALCALANIRVTVLPVNDPPSVTGKTVSTPEDTPIVICSTISDVDAGSTFTASICGNASNGVLGPPIVTGNQVCVTYTPNPNYNGTDNFCIQVCDNGSPVLCDTALYTVTVSAVNDPPIANDDNATTNEDTPVTINILSNDSDIDGVLDPATIDLDPLTPGVQTTYTVPGQGTFVVNPITGIVTFTPVLNFNGTVTPIPYQVCDNGTPLPSQCAQAVIHVTVTPVNDPPIVTGKTVTTPEDTPIIICSTISDVDPGSTFTAVMCGNPSSGTVSAPVVTGNQVCVTYTPNPNFNGTDNFCIEVCDNGSPVLCDTAHYTVIVTPVNDPPVAVDDYATTPEDTPVTIAILNNDSDIDGSLDPSTIDLDPSTPGIQTSYTVPGQGTFVVNPVTGIVTFTPVLNFNGTVTPIPYQVCDNGTPLPSQCDQAVIHVTVTPVNDPPVVTGKTVTTPEDTPIVICSTISDVDPGSTFTAVMCGNPSSGTVSAPVVTGNQVCVTYTPNPNFNGTDNFCIEVCDNGSPVLCDTAHYTVIVTPVNDPPVAVDDYATTPEDTPVTIAILSNDSDIDGSLDPATIDLDPSTPGIQTSYTVPGQGTFVVNPVTDIVTFTPVLNFNGVVTPIPYQVCDNGTPLPSQCAQAVIHVTVTPVNDPPVAVVDYFTTPEDTPVAGNVTGNDSDVDGNINPNGYAMVTGPAHGTISFSNNGTFIYTPAPNYNGTDSFIYSICDLGMPVYCDTAIVYITITPVNDPPVIFNEQVYICMDGSIEGNVLTNGDYDPDGTALTVSTSLVYGPSHGTFSVTSGGGFYYTPAAGFTGLDTVVTQVCDNGIPQPPACTNDTVFINVVAAVTADAGPNQQLCQQYNTFLTGNWPPAGSVGNWIFVSGPNVVTPAPANSPMATVVGLIPSPTPYVFRYTITSTFPGNTNCFSEDTMSVINYHFPSLPYAGPDQNLCLSNGSSTSTAMVANIPLYGTGTWVQQSGPNTATIADIHDPGTTVSNLIPGDYAFLWEIGNGVCEPNQDEVFIHVYTPSIANAGPDATICEGSTYVLSGSTASNFTSLVWATTGTGSFSDYTLLHPVYTPSAGDIAAGNVRLYLTAFSHAPCAASVDTMKLTINRQAIANAGPDATICETTTFTISGSAAQYYQTIAWTTTGTGSFSNAAILHPVYTASAADIAAGTVKLILTLTSASPCVNAKDTMILTISRQPLASAGPNATICETSTYTLSGSSAQYYTTLNWTTSGTGTFSNPATLHPIYTPSAADITAGTVTLTLTANANAPCNTATSSMTLSITKAPLANAGPNASICQGSTFTVSGATASNYSTILWTAPGPGTLTNAATLTPTYTPTAGQTGTVVLTLTANPNTGCTIPAVSTMTLTITAAATANAGPNATICEGSVYTLSGATATNYSSIFWTTSGTGTFNNNMTLNPVYTPGLADITAGTVVLTLHVNANTPCNNLTSSMTLTINRQAIANAGPDGTICETSTFTISGSAAQYYQTIAWTSTGTGSFSSAAILHPVYTPSAADISAGTVKLIITLTSAAPCVIARDTMVLNISRQPLASAGPNATICETSTYTLSGSSAQYYTTLNWTTSGTGTFSNPAALHPIYTPSAADIAAGTVTLTLTANAAAPCNTATSSMTLSITKAPLANAGPNASICQGSAYTVNGATASNYASILWTAPGPGTLTNAATLTPTYTPTAGQTGTVVLTLTANPNTGCTIPAVSTMTLTITAAATASAGPNATICEGSVYTLSGATATNYSGIFWTTSGTGTFNNNMTLNPVYTPGAADITAGGVVLTLHVNANAPCNNLTSSMSLFINRQAIANAGPDATICETSTFTVSGSAAQYYQTIAWTTTGTGSFSNATILHPVYTASAADIAAGTVKLIITLTSAAPCVNAKDTMVLSISRQPVASAGPNATICETTTYTLSGSSATYYTTLNWTTSGTGTFSNPAALHPVYTPSPADIAAGTVTLTLTANANAPCNTVVSSMTLSITRQALAYAGPNATICETSTYTLAASTAQYYATILWTTSGTGTFNNTATLHPVYTPSAADIAAGSVILTLNLTSNVPCANASSSMTLSISRQPVASAGPNATICETTTYTLSGSSATYYASLNWTTSGTGTFSNPAALHPVYTPSAADIAAGTVTLTLTANAAAPCNTISSSMTLSITRQALAYAGPNATICETSTYTLAASTAQYYATILWTTSGTGTFNNTATLHPVYTPSAADIAAGTVVLTLNLTANSPCANTSSSMTLSISRQPVASAGPNATICETSTYTLSGSSATFYTTLNWTTSGTGTFSNPAALHPIYTPSAADIAAGTVTLTLTANANAPCNTVTSSMTLSITRQPLANAGPNATICETSTYTLSGSSAQYYTTLSWTTSGTGTFSNATILHPIYTPSAADIAAGTVVLTLQANAAAPCSNVTSSMTLTISRQAIASAGPNATICEGSTYQLNGSTVQYGAGINWTTSGTGTFSNPAVLHPIYTPSMADIVAGTVTLTMTVTSASPCGNAVSSMVLTINRAPVANAGANSSTCQGVPFTVTTATAQYYSSLLWTAPGPGVLTNANTLNPTYTPAPAQTGTVVLTLTVTGNAPCGQATSQMTLTIVPKAAADAGPDATICEGSTFTVLGSTASNYSSLLWSTSGTGTYVDATVLHPIYMPSAADVLAGTIKLRLQANGNAPCSFVKDSMYLTITRAPIADAGPNGSTCQGQLFMVTGATASYYNTLLWTTNGMGTLAGQTTLTPTYQPAPFETGTITLTLTVTGNSPCGVVVDQMTIDIVPAPEANAGPDASICQGSSYTVYGASASNYNSILWTSNGTGTLTNSSSLTPTYTPGTNESGTVILSLTAYGYSPCGTAADMMLLNISRIATASAGPDLSTCGTAPVTIAAAAATNYQSLLWTTSGSGSFNDPTILHPVYTPSQGDLLNGQVVLTLTAISADPCPETTDEMTLVISKEAVANAGPDQSTCQDMPYMIIGAVAQNYVSLLWSSNGLGSLTGATTLTPTYTPASGETGQVTLTLTVTPAGPCAVKTDQMVLTISKSATAYAGADASSCGDVPFALSGATATNYSGLTWTTSGTGSFSDAHALNPVYTPSPVDVLTGHVVLTLTIDPIVPCNVTTSHMTLTLAGSPLANAGPDGSSCPHAPFTVTGATAQNYSSILWTTSGTGTLSGQTTLTPTYTPGPGESGTVTLTLTIHGTGGCLNSIATSQMNIVFRQSIAVNAGTDQTIPKSATTTLTGAASGGSGAYTFSWQPANLLVNASTENPETVPLDNNTTFILTVTDVLSGCQNTDTVQIFMDANIQVIAALNNYDTTGVNIAIDVNELNNDTFTRSQSVSVTLCGGPEHGTASVFSDNQIRYTPARDFNGKDSLCYILCYNDYPEICDTAEVYIYISTELAVDWLIIPNVITPNGDGVNDEWIIDGIEKFPDNSVKIFNRWGDKVKTFEGYNNTSRVWRGENEQNQPLPDGTYYYVLTIKDGGTRTGWIYIRGSSR